MKPGRLKLLTPVIGLGLFLLSLWILHRTLGGGSYRRIFDYLSIFPPQRILAAVGLTLASYGILTFYDHLALRYLNRQLGIWQVSLASFINYCFSRNMGFALLTGGSIRYRFYSAWGLSAGEIARLISFAAVTFTLGLLTMGGLLLLSPSATPPALSLPVGIFKPLGLMSLALAVGYLLLVFCRAQPLWVGKWEVPLPSFRQALTQVLIGSVDWSLKAGILYFLLAEVMPLSLPDFLKIYLLGQIIATISHVPGGLGVFEAAMVAMIPEVTASEMLAILLVYRGIYFLLPFGMAILLLGGLETLQHARHLPSIKKYLGNWLSPLAPPVYAAAIVLCGAILIFSCVTPTITGRLQLLGEFVPLPLIEGSHFLLALIGAGLLLIARGVMRRLQAAYIATTRLLSLAAVLTLLKGLTYEQAILLCLVLVAFMPGKQLFYRQTSLIQESFSRGWITIILIIFLSGAWLVTISYDPASLTPENWWHFAVADDAARSLRALLGVAIVLTLFAICKSRRAETPQGVLADLPAMETAGEIIRRQPVASTNLALLGDKSLLFSAEKDAFLMYAATEQFGVALEGPIGNSRRNTELAWCFREICERRQSLPVFYLIQEDFLPVCLDMGMAFFKFGDEGRFTLGKWCEEEVSRGVPQFAAGQWCFAIEEPGDFESFTQSAELAGQWLPEDISGLGFSQGLFAWDYFRRFPLAKLYCDEQPAAFALVLPTAAKQEFTIDLLHFSPRFGTGAAAVLIRELMAWGHRAGFADFSFGVVPDPAVLQRGPVAHCRFPGPAMFRNGRCFATLQELGDFVTGLRPGFSPRYAAFPGEVPSRDVLAGIAELAAGTVRRRERPFASSVARYCPTGPSRN